jgi:hypothetical protein
MKFLCIEKKMIIKYLIIITLFACIKCDSNMKQEEECCFNTNKAFKKETRITLSNFNNLNELKFKCTKPIEMSILQLIPNTPIIIDDSLELKNLKINSADIDFAFVLTNFKGFDLGSNPFKDVLINNEFKCYYFHIDSNFDFYLNKTLINRNNCNENLPNLSFMKQTRVLILEKSNKNSAETCPIVFKNMNLIMLSIKVKLSLIYTNSITFQNVSIKQDLNCTIFETILSVYRADLSSKLFNEHIFKTLKILDIYGVINKIEVDSFINFNQLHILKIKSQNIKNIFVTNNKWLKYLNKDIIVEDLNNFNENILVLLIYQSIENVTYYSYPNEDLCLFKDFPHQRLVVPILRPNTKSKCTCTELFLIQYSYKYTDFIDYLNKNNVLVSSDYMYEYIIEEKLDKKMLHQCLNTSINDMLKNCKFKQTFANCNIKTVRNKKDKKIDIYVYDFMQISDLIEFIFIKKYVNLIFLAISVLINILMITILSVKTFNTSYMYNYLNIHCVFNLLFCLISIINYILGDCSNDDIFCSELYESIELKYTKVILIKLIGNAAKTCSNIAHISFCLSRYKKMKGLDYLLIKSFNNLSTKLYLILIIIFSILLNLYKYFQFSLYFKTSFKFHRLSDFFTQYSFYDYKETLTSSEYIILNVFQYLNVFFSDLTYIIAITTIDILLFRLVKKQLAAKHLLLTQSNVTQQSNEKLTAEQRISRMIILNGINYFIFRLPLAIVNFYGFFFRYDEKQIYPNLISYIVCRKYKFCKNLTQFLYFIYLISYFFQFFIFYKLDKNFHESAVNIKNKIKKIFKKN